MASVSTALMVTLMLATGFSSWFLPPLPPPPDGATTRSSSSPKRWTRSSPGVCDLTKKRRLLVLLVSLELPSAGGNAHVTRHVFRVPAATARAKRVGGLLSPFDPPFDPPSLLRLPSWLLLLLLFLLLLLPPPPPLKLLLVLGSAMGFRTGVAAPLLPGGVSGGRTFRLRAEGGASAAAV